MARDPDTPPSLPAPDSGSDPERQPEPGHRETAGARIKSRFGRSKVSARRPEAPREPPREPPRESPRESLQGRRPEPAPTRRAPSPGTPSPRPSPAPAREQPGPRSAERAQATASVSSGGLPVSIGTAVMFMTRLPVGRHGSADPAVLARSTSWFPLVGLIVGIALASVWAVVQAFAPSSIACVATLVAGALITGAFHEDGLADVADSAGAFDVDAKLEIMRDSRVGTYGALALVLLVLARFVFLWELSVLDVATVVAAIITAHVAARWSSVWLMARVPYARPEANNRVVAEGVGQRQLLEASALGVLFLGLAFLLAGWTVLLALPVTLFVTGLAGLRFRRRLGGITGDCLGAANVMVELAVLLTVLLAAGT